MSQLQRGGNLRRMMAIVGVEIVSQFLKASAGTRKGIERRDNRLSLNLKGSRLSHCHHRPCCQRAVTPVVFAS